MAPHTFKKLGQALPLALLFTFGYDIPAMEHPQSTPCVPYPLERRGFMALVSDGLFAAPLAAEA